MIPKRVFIASAVAGCLLVTIVMLLSSYLKQELKMEAAISAHRVKAQTEISIQKAFRSKDELAIQEHIQALAQVPGVHFACVVSPDGTVVAHSRISQIGQPFTLSQTMHEVYRYPLIDDQRNWGTLVFSMSSNNLSILWRHIVMGAWACAGLLLLMFVGYVFAQENRIQVKGCIISELEESLKENRKRFEKLDRSLQDIRDEAVVWAHMAIQQMPHGMMLLDHRQRIVAANGKAASAMGFGSEAELVSKSWHDLPQSEWHRDALEKSIHSPDSPALSSPPGLVALEFTGIPINHGTWMRVIESQIE